MGKEILMFGDIEIEKNTFYHDKSPVPLRHIDTEKVLVSNKISFGKKNYKYFLDYLYHDHKVKLHILLPKTSTYVKRSDGQTKSIYFLIKDDDLLEIYNTLWDKVSAVIKKEFDCKPIYNRIFEKQSKISW